MDFSPIWFSCSFCRKAFQFKDKLMQHKKKVHLEELKRKRRRFWDKNDDSSSEDEVNDESYFEMKTIKKEVRRSPDLELTHNSGVTFWTESSTTNIIYLSDDPESDQEKEKEKNDQELLNCQNCSQIFRSSALFNLHVEKCGNFVEEKSRESIGLEIIQNSKIQETDLEPQVQVHQIQPSEKEPVKRGKSEGKAKAKAVKLKNISKFLKIVPSRQSKSPQKKNEGGGGGGPVKRFNCQFCCKSFCWEKSLIVHCKNSHGKGKDFKNITKNEKDYLAVDSNSNCSQLKEILARNSPPEKSPPPPLPPPSENGRQKMEEFLDGGNIQNLTYYCQLCTQNFTNTTELTQHMEECQLNCQMALKSYQLLEQVQRDKEIQNWWTQFYSSFYLNLFPPTPNLINSPELINLSQDVNSTSEFTCWICHKSFGKKRGLIGHIKTHTKPYKCSDCAETFSKSCLLKKHSFQVHKSLASDHHMIFSVGSSSGSYQNCT